MEHPRHPQLAGFRRGGGSLGRRCARAPAVIAVAIVDGEAEIAALADRLPVLAAMDRICAARTLLVDAGRTGITTREKDLRNDDGQFGGLLLIEGLDSAAVAAALATSGLAGETYIAVFSLFRDALNTGREQP